MSANTSASAHRQIARLSRRLRTAATDVVWTQWSGLESTATGRGRARSIVDPEALVLFSLSPVLDERRLRDLVSDWTARHSSLLSVQRIKNLATKGPREAQQRLATVARLTVEAGRDFRWRSLAQARQATHTLPRRSNKVRIVDAPNFGPAAMWLKLRLVLGVGIKADMLAFLLGTSDPVSARAISAATSYTVAAVGRALDDLVTARLVLAVNTPRQASRYRVRTDAWTTLLDIDDPMPAWRDWHERFAFVDDVLTWTDAARDRTVSRYAFGVKGRELMQAHRTLFDPEHLAVIEERRAMQDTAEHVERSIDELAAKMEAEV